MKQEAIVKSAFIVKEAVGNLYQAIAEHRWKDALALLPTVTALSHHKISPYFLWRAVHIVMLNCGVPQSIQYKVMLIFLKSSVKKQDVVIDWITNSFPYIDEQNLEQLYQTLSKHDGIRSAMHPMGILFQGYYALYFYFQWKGFSLKDSHDRQKYAEKAMLKHQLGLKAYRLLQKTLFHQQFSAKKHGKEELCEWILAPLLEMEEYHYKDGRKNHQKNQSDVVSNDRGLSMIRDYMTQKSFQLPTLIVFYNYVITYCPEETTISNDLLKEIVTLSPENSLVLDHVNSLLLSCNCQPGDLINCVDTDEDGTCLLAGQNVDTLLECVRLLCTFLEYEMRWKHLKAWTTLTSVLRIFHLSWIECWDCKECKKSRNGLEEIAKTLVIWPTIFWSSHTISNLSSHPQVLVHRAYTAFFFGYYPKPIEESLEVMNEYGCLKEKALFLSLVKSRGNCPRNLNLYLSKRRCRFISDLATPCIPQELRKQSANLTILPEKTFEVSRHLCVKFKDMKNTSELPYLGNSSKRKPVSDVSIPSKRKKKKKKCL